MSSFGIFLLITFIILPITVSLILIKKIWQRNRQDFYILLISIFITAGLITLYELNKLSSYEVIQVLLTATLVLVTADYALHTKKMADAMENQNRYNVQPIITIEPAHNPFRIIKSDTRDIITIDGTKFKNIGVGPALNLSFSLFYPDHSFDPYSLKVFEKGSERSYDFGTPFTRSSNPSQNCEATIVVKYADIFKNLYWSKISFTIDEQKKNITRLGNLEIGEGSIEP